VDVGMVNAAVPGEDLLREACALASRIARFEPVALDWCKKALDEIPSQIADWNVAMEYGVGVEDIVRDQLRKGGPAQA
jgi:enoyl-CoA hydratase/carnithine racemase